MKTIKNTKNNTHSLRSFLLLWASQSISAMGTAMTDYALVVWIYGQNGTTTSVSLLTLCSFAPTILFRFVAGAVADRWNKKAIMLAADLFAACGTLTILLLHSFGALTILPLYVITFALSLMNAFQVPAAYVATSLLIPREQYARAGGLQAVSGAVQSILSPALGAAVLAWGGLTAVLCIDLITFAIAFAALVCLRIPRPPREEREEKETLLRSCLAGLRYLKGQPHMLRLILFIAAVNLLAKLGPDGQMAAFVLSRSGNHQPALGAVQMCVSLGIIAGGLLMTGAKPVKDRGRAVVTMCCLIFLTGIGLAVSRSVTGWCLFAFLQYSCAAIMNVNWETFMRTQVPERLLGRVYSTRDTIQNGTIPLGLFLGGWLADRVFGPLSAEGSQLHSLLGPLLGAGPGMGLALLFLLVGLSGLLLSVICLMKRIHQPSKAGADQT